MSLPQSAHPVIGSDIRRSPSPARHAVHHSDNLAHRRSPTNNRNNLHIDTNLARTRRNTDSDNATNLDSTIPLIHTQGPPIARVEMDELDEREEVGGTDAGYYPQGDNPDAETIPLPEIIPHRPEHRDIEPVDDDYDRRSGRRTPVQDHFPDHHDNRPRTPSDPFGPRPPFSPGFGPRTEIEFGTILPDGESIPDVNLYQQKKTLAQGFLDLALFSANANQLRYVLESYDRHPYYYPSVVMITFSLICQVAVGVGLIMNSRYNVKDEKEICHANKINNLTIIGIFLVTVINVFISAFGVAPTQPVSP